MTIPRQFLLFRDLFLWTKINWKHYWRSIQVPSDHRVVSRAASNVWRGENWKYTVFCYKVITVNFSEADKGELSRSEPRYQSVWAEADEEAMTGHIGWEGRGNPWSLRDLYRCEDECWTGCVGPWAQLSGDMPHLSKLSEPRQRRGDH